MATKTTVTDLAVGYGRDEIDLIKSMCAQNATDDEFRVLLHMADKYKLDPLAKQIYLQKYKSSKSPTGYAPAAIIITYAGMLEIANRDNMLDGIECEVFTRAGEKQPYKAKSTLWKKGCSHPFVSEVAFDEYVQFEYNSKTPSGLWATKPITMLKKVANAQNLRQAFSLGQMYIEEEMPPAPVEVIEPKVVEPAPEPTTLDDLPGKLRDRYILAQKLELEYGVKTVDRAANWLNTVKVGQVLDATYKMIGAKSFKEIIDKTGLENFEGHLHRYAPDAQTQAMKFAATIHLVAEWYEKHNHQLELEAGLASV